MATGAGRYVDGENAAKLAEALRKIEDLEDRVRKLERWQSWVLGVGAAVVFGIGILASNAWNTVKGLLHIP